jgi:hypothetical protein
MIAKTFFLMKVIHRIGTRSLRGKKSLHENPARYRTFFALWAARRRGDWAARRISGSADQRISGAVDHALSRTMGHPPQGRRHKGAVTRTPQGRVPDRSTAARSGTPSRFVARLYEGCGVSRRPSSGITRTSARTACAEGAPTRVRRPQQGADQFMRILVTGGAGFTGSHYVRTLLSGGCPGYADAAVTALDTLTYAGNLANLDPVAGRFGFVRGSS